MPALFDLTGKKALVTGGGRGLGRAIAVGLAQHGADVAVTSRTVAELEETAQAVAETGRRCLVVPGDASQKAEIDRVVGEVAAGLGQIDILVNNAGVDAAAPAIDYSEADWDFVLDVNLKAYFFFAQAVARVMIVNGGGAIANNSSICGEVAVKNISAYNISKGGVNMMTKSLALEWATHGIRVNAFSPAYMDVFMPGAAGEHDEAKEQAVRDNTPIGRRGRPEELVGPVVFLVSDASSYVTGEVLMVDGGWTIR
ncbi:MAG: glucose 1-dehydrogenase [Ilumatobacteraceae bacterium]